MNWARLQELRDEVGEDALAEVLEMFLEETDEVANRLAVGIPPEGICEAMHFMKGAALNIGFSSLASLCQTAETAAASDPNALIDVDAILTCYCESKEQLEHYDQGIASVA